MLIGLTSCSTVEYVKEPVNCPPKSSYRPIKAEEIVCLSKETTIKLAERNQAMKAEIKEFRAITECDK